LQGGIGDVFHPFQQIGIRLLFYQLTDDIRVQKKHGLALRLKDAEKSATDLPAPRLRQASPHGQPLGLTTENAEEWDTDQHGLTRCLVFIF
jgi:hypothetical protein